MIRHLRYPSAKMLVLADQAVVSGASFLTNILVAHTLGIRNYGVFSLIVLVQLFLLSLQQAAGAGIYQVMYAKVEPAKQQMYTDGLLYTKLLAYLLLLLPALAGYAFVPAIAEAYQTIFLPAALGTVLYLLQDFLRKALLTQQKERKALAIDLITNMAQLLLLGLLALSGKLTLSLTCWVIAITFIPSVIAGLWWIRPGRFSPAHIRLVLELHRSQSGWMLLSALLQWFAGNFFVVAAGWWLGMAAFGALRLVQYIFGLLNVVLQAIENYAVPKASRLLAADTAFGGFLQTVLKQSLLLFGPALLLLSVFAKPLLRLSGGDAWTGYSYVIYGLALVYLLIITGLPLRIVLRVRLLNRAYFLGYVLSAVFSLLTARWLIVHWQLVGVLTGLFLTQLIVIVYWLLVLKRKNILTWRLFTSY